MMRRCCVVFDRFHPFLLSESRRRSSGDGTRSFMRWSIRCRSIKCKIELAATALHRCSPLCSTKDVLGRSVRRSSIGCTVQRDFHWNIEGNIPRMGVGVAVGQCSKLNRVFTSIDVDRFSALSGDHNLLHRSWEMRNIPDEIDQHPLLKMDHSTSMSIGNDGTATTLSSSKTRILVHGMLVSSLFTCIFGTLIPGAVYLRQSLDFRKPVYADDPVVGVVTIQRIRKFKSGGLIVTCDTKVLSPTDESFIFVKGEADVWMTKGEELVM